MRDLPTTCWRSRLRRWMAARRRPGGMVHHRSRLRVEGLEDRALLASITEFPIPSMSPSASQIVAGPDGNLWFTENDPVSNSIGRITPSGQITEFKLPTSGANPYGITVGPDNNLWFTEEFGSNIGRITTSGQITEFPIAAGGSSGQFPQGITTGPDGNLWFTVSLGHAIGVMTPSGQVTEYLLPALASPDRTSPWGPTTISGSRIRAPTRWA